MPRSFETSKQLYSEALQLIPGGVNSPVRAFKNVGADPIFIDRGKGSHFWDADGNEYLDFVSSWGPLILGHAYPDIIEAISTAAANGTTFGASTRAEVNLAQKIINAVPSIEKVRLVSSGTEAVMSAVRTARGFTRRDLIIKFAGNYHGHSDQFLSKAGSGLTTFDLPDSAGVPPGVTQDVITIPYNNIPMFEEIMQANRGKVACVVVEPIAGNMGVVPPEAGYLECLRRLTTLDGAILLFDEVITGFRVALGGAQELFGVVPDMSTLGKIIGGGLPLAAYGGRAEIMDMVAPSGPVYQAGTLSGNPVAVAAGLAQLTYIEKNRHSLYSNLDRMTAHLCSAITDSAKRHGVSHRINRIGSMFTLFFTDTDVVDYSTAKLSNTERYGQYFRLLLDSGIFIAPSQFEAAFLSAAYTQHDIEFASETVDKVLFAISQMA